MTSSFTLSPCDKKTKAEKCHQKKFTHFSKGNKLCFHPHSPHHHPPTPKKKKGDDIYVGL